MAGHLKAVETNHITRCQAAKKSVQLFFAVRKIPIKSSFVIFYHNLDRIYNM